MNTVTYSCTETLNNIIIVPVFLGNKIKIYDNNSAQLCIFIMCELWNSTVYYLGTTHNMFIGLTCNVKSISTYT